MGNKVQNPNGIVLKQKKNIPKIKANLQKFVKPNQTHMITIIVWKTTHNEKKFGEQVLIRHHEE